MARFEDTFPPYVAFGSRNLSLQSPNLRGTDVAVAQAVYNLMLTAMNPPQGPMGGPITADSVFGPKTQAAVRNIQSYFGLTVDGAIGPNTFFVYGQGVGPNTTYGGPVYGSRSLSQGMSGGDVTILQNRLNCFRYASLIGHPADGSFDSATAQAVLAFKRDAANNGDTGFPANATVGDGAFDATWLYTFAGGRAIQTGRNGFDVVFLQTILQRLGYYGGRVQGYYDAATRAAVIAFQTAVGIAADGVVGPATFFKIGQHNQLAAPGPLGIAWPAAQEEPVPGPVFVDCASALTPEFIPGGSIWLRQGPDNEATVIVTGINLPSPVTFGPDYDRYWYTIQEELVRQMGLVQVGFAMWQGVHSGTDMSVPFPADARIWVQVGDHSGPTGPVVLSGTVGECTGQR
jgi:peptidoglycan hydrolase-like protein with peptidoglycan-binding domain